MRALVTLLWLAGAGLTVWFAAQDVGLAAQVYLAGAALAAVALMRLLDPKGPLRILLTLVMLFVSLRYFTWRSLDTLPAVSSPGFVAGVLLFAAEGHGFLMYLLGLFANFSPIDRPAAPLAAYHPCASGRSYW